MILAIVFTEAGLNAKIDSSTGDTKAKTNAIKVNSGHISPASRKPPSTAGYTSIPTFRGSSSTTAPGDIKGGACPAAISGMDSPLALVASEVALFKTECERQRNAPAL